MSSPFRQIIYDFHISPAIVGVGRAFNKTHWQETLIRARVNQITLFAKCHHGWSYHATLVGQRHPGLDFDLLSEQLEACREIGVQAPIYLSAGFDNVASYEHPEWRAVGVDGRYTGRAQAVTEPGYHEMCFHTPYLDYLCAQIREVLELFPGNHGIFLDIVSQSPCCCRWCLGVMREQGLDPNVPGDRSKCAELALDRYYRATTREIRRLNPETAIFHNSGHIQRGRREVLRYQSHLEIESLPTGGWGYDHFPASAKYCINLDKDFVGMTAKFHTTWGEFGGYKHPNALRYECSAMLAFGAKCSVGDILHPDGRMDDSTYEMIGTAFGEVESKEVWCEEVIPIAEIGLLSSEAEHPGATGEDAADTGACRILLEGHFLFTVIDREMDFSKYLLLILPDTIRLDSDLQAKLGKYLSEGGKLFLTGESGLSLGDEGFALNIGAEYFGPSPFAPDYALPTASLCPSFVNAPLVMYLPSQRIVPTTGESLGEIFEPYFNRNFSHFCGHQHTPPQRNPSGFVSGVLQGNILYLAHPVFSIYRHLGAVAYKEYVIAALRLHLGSSAALQTNLPSSARVSLMRQSSQHRTVLHLLYANPMNRGGEMTVSGGNQMAHVHSVEVIEELLPLHNVEISWLPPAPVSRVTLEPQGVELSFATESGRCRVHLASFTCHQMIVFHDQPVRIDL